LSNELPEGTRERADRRRNRDTIVKAAREAFARGDAAGETVSMNEIARAANVGPATLYRHFATRDELADAVYQAKIDEVTGRVLAANQGEDGLTTLRAWVAEFASFMLATRGIMDTLRAAWQSANAATSPTAAKITTILGGFVVAGKKDGSIRGGVDPADLTIAVLALLSSTPPGDSGGRSLRLLKLVTDGLAATQVQPSKSAVTSQL
jgi:AcrR family transcriptional regulator